MTEDDVTYDQTRDIKINRYNRNDQTDYTGADDDVSDEHSALLRRPKNKGKK